MERGFRCRRPFNEAEGEFYDKMTAAGWTVTKRGWPDFFCVDASGDVCLVEVKPSNACRLKREQTKVMRYLSSKGIKCYRWDPVEGFSRDFD